MITMTNDNNNDLVVITTKYVIEKKSPILYVFHYAEDECWQFSGEEQIIEDKDFRVVSMEEIIKLDKTILEVLDLPLGWGAERKSILHPWYRGVL